MHLPAALQYCAAEHSPSFVHSMHTLDDEHLPERHCGGAAHGPSPVARPQRLSVGSHAPLAQTAAPAPGVHVPESAGVWPVTVGTGWPLSSFATHVSELVLHHCVASQSPSTAHPPAGTHTLPIGAHLPERQTTPPSATVHGPWPLA